LISHRARDLPDKRILGYPSDGIQYKEYTYSQLKSFSTKAASIYAENVSARSSKEPERVVALLAASNLDYLVTALALSRLGFTVLFLSTRISEAAYISLLNDTKCRILLVDSSFQRTASSVQSTLSDLQILRILEYAQYASATSHVPSGAALPEFNLDEEKDRTCWIIHSSGSTGLPKPIYQTHQAALRNYENNMNMIGFITLPLFHAHGLSSVFRAITSVKMIYMYNASLPLTKQNLLGVMHQHQFEIFYGVPYALKLLSETEEGIKALAAMKVVMFGGSACPDTLGDQLVDGGVNLISHYGTTETGQLMTSFRPCNDKAWNYVRVHEKLQPYVRWEERGANLFELVVLAGWPSKVATNRPDGAYATKDLFEPHPTISGAWKYNGRLDDTIVLMNGEKAIPIAMEQAIRQNLLAREAVMFGSGKSRLGMIVIASESASCMPAQELLKAIWPTIEKENKQSPSYAQLSPEMVSILPSGTPYPQTDKGTVIRQAFYRTFHQDIEEVYKRLESNSFGTLVLSAVDMRKFLRTEVIKFIPSEDESSLLDDTDLFSLGIDSLQSTRLRGAILQQLQFNGHPVPQNVVFENPTIDKLADELIRIRDRKSGKAKNVIKEMEDLVLKYGTFPQHTPKPATSANTCIVVTGATGSLGAHIVAQLASRDDISEVCCLMRAGSDESARYRVIRSMQERAVYHSLSLSARRKVKCFKSDFSKTKLGLGDELYEALRLKITALIHCAWSVNFNKSLSSFEADCIAGACHLMTLCLSAQRPTPASFNFCSSVSTVARTPTENVPEALPESFACAQGMGYAQSKLVTENLVAKAAAETGMNARVLRIGQIIADTTHGIWNDTEAIPLMLQAATTIKALPMLDEAPRWLPVDTVASTILDISLSSTSQTVLNVVNPQTFHWTRDLLPCLHAAGLSFDEVDQREWIRRLRASNPDPSENPTIKLVEFFASKYDNDVHTRKSMGYTTKAAEALSPALASMPQLSQELVTKFIRHFLRTSWAAPAEPSTQLSASVGPPTRLIIISGPCGSGKSTVASSLADRFKCATIEDDSVHDSIAITKMSRDVPISELDRQIWLTRVKTEVLERVRAARILRQPAVAEPPAQMTVVVTCSALKREHRDALRSMLSDGSIETQFVALQASEDELTRRVGARKGHHMKDSMVASQLAAVEEPMIDEIDVLPVDAEEGSVKEIVDGIFRALER
jgi:carbohydrate kinase (thermoresistant glucokinase family)